MTYLQKFLKDNKLFILFVLLMSVFRSAVADWYTVPTGSMQPTIKEGDRIIVNKMAYDLRLPFSQLSLLSTGEPKRGEIVVFESKTADKRLIKRMVGLPGDRISMKEETLYINGQAMPYKITKENPQQLVAIEQLGAINHSIRIDKERSNQRSTFSPLTVPDGYYFVLGDNRRNSADSRVYGLVPRHELKGKASSIAFSVNYDNYYLPRANRFFKDIYSI
ncbi:signal peptidase I [Colwellia sp. 4_MG-2023]|jgi:signal peptidase I|uniref:signal peptidase I n=1 Tax=unclassified Colwellia TaxID=196834 RepID=UPI001C09C8A0|nr:MULTISPECIES: signal peptidase I [unclassified Colwellia]MBU2923506.1 signal peptidase I [Colwellia sp. C2M11]MDO6505964.1 signal peptidase I [Colwellia sp. 5_MG-2023]MDO6554645.1 signal peptidase I [Colwellia sp. 4_MG-2023]MDO6653320.1 signal peptidase I [Colwellia sp. 3_MG-2023]MDO6664435.1 signal peptidase I [Colwellia sp. 2_MG-2023]